MKIKYYLIIVFIIGFLIDLINGYVQIHNQTTILPVVFKGLVFIYSIQFVISNTRVLLCFLAGTLFFFFDLEYWIIKGYIESYTALIDHTIRIVYPLVVLIVLYVHKEKINRDEVLHYALYYGLLASIVIIAGWLFGFGTHSYGSDYGYGTKGLFNAGNDIGLSIIMSNGICAYFLSTRNEVRYVIYSIIFAAAGLLLGSTAALAGILIITLLIVLQTFFFNHSFPSNYYRYKYFLLLMGLPFIIISIYYIANTDSYTMAKFDINNIMEGRARNSLKEAFYNCYENFSWGDNLFGIGKQKLFQEVGYYFTNTKWQRSLEVDHLELIGTYGFLLGGLLIFYPLFFLMQYIRCFFYQKDLFPFWASIVILLFISHGFLAGHAYTSISAGIVLSAILVFSDYNTIK